MTKLTVEQLRRALEIIEEAESHHPNCLWMTRDKRWECRPECPTRKVEQTAKYIPCRDISDRV